MTPAENSSAGQPLLYAFAAFAGGIAVAGYIHLFGWIAIFASSLLSAFVFRKRPFAFALVMVLFVSLGAVCFDLSTDKPNDRTLRTMLDNGRIAADFAVEYEGIVASLPDVSQDAVVIDLDVERFMNAGETHEISGRLRLFVRLDSAEAAADMERLALTGGSRIRVNCSADRSGRFLDPGVLPRDVLLARQGIDAVANVKSPLLIEKLDAAGFSPFDGVLAARQWTIREFRRLFDDETAGVLVASLLGNKQFLDRQTAEIFRDGGTFHVLVISGLHITFIGALLLFFVRMFTGRRMAQFVVSATLLWTYSIAVGAGSPVIRAVVMFTIFLFGYAVYRTGSLTNTLGACGLVLLAWRPNDLFDPSFQLTMVSVGAIVAAAFPLIEKLRAVGKWTPSAATPLPPNVPNWLRRFAEMLYWNEDAWRAESRRHIWSANIAKRPYLSLQGEVRNAARYVFEGIVVSAIVQAFMLPLLIYYFHRVPLGSVVLNIWVGVVLAAESFAAAAAVVMAQVSPHFAAPFVWLAETSNWLLTAAQQWFIDLGFGSLRIPIYGEFRAAYLLYFVPILAAAILLARWQPFALKQQDRKPLYLSVAVICVFAAVLVFHPFSEPKPDGRLHVTFLDVGQGDAAFIVFPNGETMLVDGGGRIDLSSGENAFEPDIPRIGEMVVSEYLWELGYSRVDHIAASHPDVDHVQGLEDIARNFHVRDLLFAAAEANDDDMNRLFAEADERGIERVELTAGDTFEIGGAAIEVLGPPAGADLSDNDSSLVFRLSFNGVTFLFTGDIERTAEEMLVNAGAELKANVIKVPHHGSRTSSSQNFVDAVNAAFAVISVGRRSMFGHPHKEVVDRWNDAGAKLIKTGESGAVTFVVDDGGRVSLKSFAEK